MSQGNRQVGTPMLLTGPAESGTLLQPVPLTRPPFDEAVLQSLLAANPAVLPTEEIDPAYTGLRLLGREVGTQAGPIDIVYATEAGHLALVETKLWKNPEARREVVGQIIDYAKELSHWSFEDLDAAVRKALRLGGQDGKSIVGLLRQSGASFEEPHLIDAIGRNLRSGRFLLLIVGDGIREGVEEMARYLSDVPSLQFTLALVELALFRTVPGQDWPLLIQPRLTTRTQEVVRAVVEIKAPESIQVDVELPESDEDQISGKRRKLTEGVYLSELKDSTDEETVARVTALIDALRDRGCVTEWRASSVSLRYPDPGISRRRFTVVVLTSTGEFYLGWLAYVSDRAGYDETIWRKYLNRVLELTKVSLGKSQDSTAPASVRDLLDAQPEFLSAVDRFLSDLKAAAADEV